MIEAAEAVHHAHQRGILHRDLKPANILLDEQGHPHVTDFGLAKRLEGDSELTASGAIMGTPPTCAPEQAAGQRGAMTTATDVYGLGAILYALLTGRPRSAATSVMDTLEAVRTRPPEPPSKLNARCRATWSDLPEVPGEGPGRRYARAAALAADLRRFWPASRSRRGRGRRARGQVGAAESRRWPPRTRWDCWRCCSAGWGCGRVAVAGRGTGTRCGERQAGTTRRKPRRTPKRRRDGRESGPGPRPSGSGRNSSGSTTGGPSRWPTRMAGQQHPRHPGLAREHPGRPPRLGVAIRPSPLPFRPAHAQGAHRRPSASFSPDGSQIVTGSRDHTAKVWDAKSGAELLTLKGHTGRVTSASFSPDGSRIVTGSEDETAKVWDAKSGAEVLTTQGAPPVAGPFGVIQPRRLADRHRDVTDGRRRSGTPRAVPRSSRSRGTPVSVPSASFSPDGSRIVTGSRDNTAKVWDAKSGAEVLTLKGHTGRVTSASFSPDGSRIVTGSNDKTAKVWDAKTGAEVLTLKGHTSGFTSASFSPDGSRIVTGERGQDGEGLGRHERCRGPHAQGAHRHRHFGVVQPRRLADRHRE